MRQPTSDAGPLAEAAAPISIAGRDMDLFLILSAGVLCLVWGAVLLRRGGLLAGSLTVLLARRLL